VVDLQSELQQQATERRIRKAFVKVKFSDFTRTTKECLCAAPTKEVFQTLLSEAYLRRGKDVRLLGVGVRFEDPQEELLLQALMPF
jgi:DNA polymerase IV